MSENKNKFKVKVAIAVKDLDTKKYEQEFVQIRFINDIDRQAFIKIFTDINGMSQANTT